MLITVTPVCAHPDGYHSSGEPVVGKRSLNVTTEGVWVDGRPAIQRDRRALRDREPGHSWFTRNNHPDPRYQRIQWTGFRIEVEP